MRVIRHSPTHGTADVSGPEEAFAGESEIWSCHSDPRRADSAVSKVWYYANIGPLTAHIAGATRKVDEYLLFMTITSTNILVLASQFLLNVFHILGAFYLNHSIYFRLTPH